MTGARRALATLLVALTLLPGCSQDGSDQRATAPATRTDATTTEAPPAEAEAIAPGGWEKVRAPATCRCSDGSPYHFWLRRGDPERVLVHLEGGGACFSAQTCGPTDPTYKPTLAGDLSDGPGMPGAAADQGVFDLDEPRNPFADWSMVYIPYCTGDLHLGDAAHDYGDGVVVQHNGMVNGSTALAATAAAFPEAGEVVVTGSSAGSAAAPLYGGLTHDLLPDAAITVIADASAAYPGDAAITSTIGAWWGTSENVPAWPTSADEPTSAWSLPGLFVRAGRHVPGVAMATINDAYDEVQARFSALIGQTGDLREAILANDAWIEELGVEVHSWVSPGTEHTILPRAELYRTEVQGVALHEWLADLVAGDEVPDVRCTECR